jgi:epoxide hydrolase 4
MTNESWRHGFAATNGIRLHYVEQGEGPLLLLLHGCWAFYYCWRNQIPALAQRFHVVAPDLRGFNDSDKPEGVDSYQLCHLVEDVRGLLRYFGKKGLSWPVTTQEPLWPGRSRVPTRTRQ